MFPAFVGDAEPAQGKPATCPPLAPDPGGPSTSVEIPREPTWLYTYAGQRVSVPLPLEARPRRVVLLVFVLLFLVIGVLCLGPLAYIGELFDPSYPTPSAAQLVVMAPVTMLMAAFGALCTGAALVALADALRRGPVLTLDGKGIRGTRIPIDVPWRDVNSLVILRHPEHGTITSLLLRLRARAPASSGRTTYLRLGISSAFRSARRRTVPVAACCLDPSSHVVTHVAAELVRRHGGRVLEFRDLLPDRRAWWRTKLRRPRRAGRS